jgi:hypothetical protein
VRFRSIIDPGDRFDRLTALEPVGSVRGVATRWLCRCSCGGTKVASQRDLKHGLVRSCGCLRAEAVRRRRSVVDPGQRFGMLTVVRRLGDALGNSTRWLVRCDCGNETTARQWDMRRGHTRSCGCLHNSPRHGHARRGVSSPVYQLWLRVCHRANVRVTARWSRFERFLADLEKLGPKPEGAWLTRIDTRRAWGPKNVAWMAERDARRRTPVSRKKRRTGRAAA